jgi:4-diphosphocytidyl-2-C-methyl-D-erythritol kinase
VSTRAARVTAHAKINLTLRILEREASGFHTLETIFARISLGDLVTVRITDGGRSLDSDVPIPGATEDNLAYRAALAFAERTGWPRGFAIELEKRIPIGGGLGGGSADAGAVLRALAALSPNQVREADLLALAASLGSDVPFLTTAAPIALAWSRGERMLALPTLPERDVVLVLPGFAVSTVAAYAWLDEARRESAPDSGAPAPPPSLLSLADLATWPSIAALATNDFEPVVFPRHPELAPHLAALRSAGASIALMSGSGSTLFGIFAAPPQGAPAHPAIPGIPPSAQTVATRTATSVSPVELLG